MTFQIAALNDRPFAKYFDMSEEELARNLAVRQIATTKPGFPCRVSLEDAEIGEEVILLNYVHQDEASPYRASHAIYVRRGVPQARPGPNEVPEQLRRRALSLRAFDSNALIVGADLVTDGNKVAAALDRLFDKTAADYIHIHFTKFGCFAARANPG